MCFDKHFPRFGQFECTKACDMFPIGNKLSCILRRYALSMTGMSMLRTFGLKLMPTSVTGRGPPSHFAA